MKISSYHSTGWSDWGVAYPSNSVDRQINKFINFANKNMFFLQSSIVAIGAVALTIVTGKLIIIAAVALTIILARRELYSNYKQLKNQNNKSLEPTLKKAYSPIKTLLKMQYELLGKKVVSTYNNCNLDSLNDDWITLLNSLQEIKKNLEEAESINLKDHGIDTLIEDATAAFNAMKESSEAPITDFEELLRVSNEVYKAHLKKCSEAFEGLINCLRSN